MRAYNHTHPSPVSKGQTVKPHHQSRLPPLTQESLPKSASPLGLDCVFLGFCHGRLCGTSREAGMAETNEGRARPNNCAQNSGDITQHPKYESTRIRMVLVCFSCRKAICWSTVGEYRVDKERRWKGGSTDCKVHRDGRLEDPESFGPMSAQEKLAEDT